MRIAAIFVLSAALVMPAAAAKDIPNDLSGGATKDGAADVPAGAPPKDAAQSSDVAELFAAFDLFGTWAADCGRPPTPANPHVSVTTPGAGLVLENNDVGPGYAANRYSVLAARRVSAERIEVKVLFRPGTEDEERQTLIFVVRNGTRRTVFNRVEDDGTVRVRNGVVLARGTKTPLLKKCG